MTMRVRSVYAGIFFLAMSILLFEIALTRVFAVMMWHHFTYMVVSIALLGFGAAGSFLTARRAVVDHASPAPGAAKLSFIYSFFVVFATLSVTLVRIDSLVIWKEYQNIVALLLIYMVMIVPFLFGGMAIGLIFARLPSRIGSLYFADLIGSAIGGAGSVWILARFGGLPTVVIAGAIGAFSAFLFSFGAAWRHRVVTFIGLLVATVTAISFSGGLPALNIKPAQWTVPFAPGKELSEKSGDTMPETVIPSATAEVEVTKPHRAAPMIGGNFGKVDRRAVDIRYVAQDGTAPTMMYEGAAKIDNFAFLDDSQAGSAYLARKVSGHTNPKVLVIGVGGGVDVMVALAAGASSVTAVEINSAMIEMVTKRYDDYLGGLFRPGGHPLADRIRLVHEEGRSFMRRQNEKFDIIQMSGVDSFTALSTGAYTLSESYLYTKEAVREFYEHLSDTGYVNYSRFILNRPKKPRETIRLANIAREALADMGIANPEKHICIFQGIDWASTMIKKSEWTQPEIDALGEFARVQEFRGIVFDPLHLHGTPFPAPARSLAQVEEFLGQAVQKPGFADGLDDAQKKGLVGDLVAAFDLLFKDDQAAAEKRLSEAAERLPVEVRDALKSRALAVLGAAVEKAREDAGYWNQTRTDFATVLSAPEAERRAYIAAYPYDLSASTDDRPFFFNYYKYSGLWKSEESSGPTSASQDRYHPDFPVGHMILLLSLVQIILLAVVLIVAPIRSLARDGVATEGRWSYLLYFAALGLGFMCVEIVLMQRFVIFLGHPTYALSVVLTSLLAGAGCGSFLSKKFGFMSRAKLYLIGALIVGAIVGIGWASEKVLPLVLGWELSGRVAASVGLLFPLGLFMGLGFPSGIRILESRCPALIPWGWAANGIFSVFASLFCIVLSMQIGFKHVLWVSATIYAVGFVFMKPELPRAADDSVEETVVSES